MTRLRLAGSMGNEHPLAAINSRPLDEIAHAINTAHDDVQRHMQTAVRRAIDAGRALNEAKAKLKAEARLNGERGKGHGKWLPWLKANCRGLAERTAQLYMRLAELLDSMPHLEETLPEVSLHGAREWLEWEYRRRFPEKAIDLREIESKLREHVYAIADLLFRSRCKLGEQQWREWLDGDLGIPAEHADQYVRMCASCQLGLTGDSGERAALPLLPVPTKPKSATVADLATEPKSAELIRLSSAVRTN